MAHSSGRQFTRKEIEARNRREDALFVIDNVVYDVTSFLQEHPGGGEVLLDNAGRDASVGFHDVGHSEDAHALMAQYAVGEVVAADRVEVRARTPAAANTVPVSPAGLIAAAAPPLLLAFVVWWYIF